MKRTIIFYATAFLVFFLGRGECLYSQALLHQFSRGDINFQLYDDGFKINSVSKGTTLLETYKLGTELPIGLASYPFSNVNYANYIHLVVQDNVLFSQWMTNSIISWTANDPIYQLDATFQNTIYNEGFTLHVEIQNNNQIRINIQKTTTLAQPWTYRTKLRLKLFPDEYFMGFGERLEGIAFRGKKMLNWISEGQADTVPSPHPENQGNFRVPFYLSTRGYGLLLNDNSCSSFDLGESNININEIAVWDQKLSFTLYTGSTPAEIIKNYTEDAGRIFRVPEPWVFGVWVLTKNRNIFQTETDRSNQVAQTLRNDSIPCSALWHHYWSEKINNILGTGMKWDLDVANYPNYSTLINSHHAKGFKVLHYYWPYIFNNDYDYNYGNTNGYFMKNSIGQTYLNQWLSFFAQVAEPDITRYPVREWYKNSILINAYNIGSSGGMIDFGEHHRIEMIDSANSNPYAVHNEYPLWWGKTNQEFWEQHQPNGDYTYWMRAGWTGIQKYSPLMWIGDPQFDWSGVDGIKTIIPAILSAGLSGHPLVSSHIAGYEYNTLPANSEELWIRWLQTCSLFPVMWTHEGSELYFGTKLVFDQSPQTLSMFKKYAKLHVQFFPYMYTLVKEGKDSGWPVARPLYFHYPDDPSTINIKDQFLLGDRVLVAPVLDSGATSRQVYFPAGNWYDFSSGALTASGPTLVTVSAPLDFLPIFVKEGTILPLYNQPNIETLVKSVPGVHDFEYADSTMEVRFYGCGEDQIQLWDGSIINMHYYSGDSAASFSGGPTRTYLSSFVHSPAISCLAGVDEKQTKENLAVYPNPTTGFAEIDIEETYSGAGTIEIYNLTGQLLRQESLELSPDRKKIRINVGDLSNGVYLLKLISSGNYSTIKIIKN